MSQVNITKRGNYYQYRFEIAPQGGSRKYVNKSGFKTKAEAQEAGNLAYTEYLNAGVPFKECNISYCCVIVGIFYISKKKRKTPTFTHYMEHILSKRT